MDLASAFLYGFAGGLGAEVFGLFQLRRSGAPQYLRSIFYWIITAVMVLFGGGVAWLYAKSGVGLTPILAVNVGAAAPLILVSQTPEVSPGRIN
jgi:hypothetical protein